MAVFLKTATPTFLLKAIFCYCQKSLYQFHFLTLSGIVIENTNFCKLHIWLVVVVSLRFYQKKAMRWTMRLQRYFKKENFCGRNLKKKKLKIFSASLDIFAEERKRERRKQLISSQRMWKRLLGCSSFWTFTRYWDDFWEYGGSQIICIFDVSKESGSMVQSAPAAT